MFRATVVVTMLAALAPAAGAAAGPDDPLIAKVAAYREARKAGRTAEVRALLAPDARQWWGERSGPGHPVSPKAGGPWAAWDDYFRSESRVVEWYVEGRQVRATQEEINDWYRLVDRPASRYYISYFFDDAGRIEGILVHRIPDAEPTPDRLDEFEVWAAENRPGLLERLMPDGEIDPALEKARLWKSALLEWRAAAGLPDPLE